MQNPANYGKPITLLDTSKGIGNPNPDRHQRRRQHDCQKVENFAENPYQLKNYLQVATGDWDNDGKDEVAVYVPEVGNSRIEIYDLQTNDYSIPLTGDRRGRTSSVRAVSFPT